jgi:hypothetical protein
MNEQGTDEWFEARLGHATASNFHKILAKGAGKTRAAYLQQLVVERLTGKKADSYSNAHMDRGTEQEPFARMAYEAISGNMVDEVGFIPIEGKMIGCSPDGLVDDNGGCEIKSRLPHLQLEVIDKGGYPSATVAQIQGSLWVTGREWWDYVSYSPDLPEHLQTYIFRVERDEKYIKTLAEEVDKFLAEVEAEVEKWRNYKC